MKSFFVTIMFLVGLIDVLHACELSKRDHVLLLRAYASSWIDPSHPIFHELQLEWKCIARGDFVIARANNDRYFFLDKQRAFPRWVASGVTFLGSSYSPVTTRLENYMKLDRFSLWDLYYRRQLSSIELQDLRFLQTEPTEWETLRSPTPSEVLEWTDEAVLDEPKGRCYTALSLAVLSEMSSRDIPGRDLISRRMPSPLPRNLEKVKIPIKYRDAKNRVQSDVLYFFLNCEMAPFVARTLP